MAVENPKSLLVNRAGASRTEGGVPKSDCDRPREDQLVAEMNPPVAPRSEKGHRAAALAEDELPWHSRYVGAVRRASS